MKTSIVGFALAMAAVFAVQLAEAQVSGVVGGVADAGRAIGNTVGAAGQGVAHGAGTWAARWLPPSAGKAGGIETTMAAGGIGCRITAGFTGITAHGWIIAQGLPFRATITLNPYHTPPGMATTAAAITADITMATRVGATGATMAVGEDAVGVAVAKVEGDVRSRAD